MKHWIPGIVEILIGLAILSLGVLVLVPVPQRPLSNEILMEPDSYNVAVSADARTEKEMASLEQIASLFGWNPQPVAAPVIASASDPAPEPLNANWMRRRGFFAGEDGQRLYLFKDERTASMIILPLGGEDEGWTLLEISDKGFLMEFQEKLYIIENK